MAEIPNVRLSVSNNAENVLLVRQALAGLGEAVGLDALELNDMNTAVSEACNNVVLHAYDGEEGPLEVDLYAHLPALRVVVRDYGRGIHNGKRAPAEDRVGGIGLPVIRALAHNVEFRELPGRGTEVQMEFARERTGVLAQPRGADGLEPDVLAGREVASALAIAITPTALARRVVPRLVCALAARAHFSTDRIADLQMLADTLVAQIDGSLNASHLGMAIGVAPRELELRIGPLSPGHADAIVLDHTLGDLGSIFQRLANGHDVNVIRAGEVLALRIHAQPQRR